MQPCYDNYSTTFKHLPAMLSYHETLERSSRWERCNVASLETEALDEGSRLMCSPSDFAPMVSQDAIADTARNLGLALKTPDGYVPIRTTAYKSLLDRAKISGSVLPKLAKDKLSAILNECFPLHGSSEALVLVRDEKVAAVHSGDEKDYSILPIDELMKALESRLDERFPGNEFQTGYSDHAVSTAMWAFPKQREDLLDTYDKALTAHGQKGLAAKLMPGIRFSTSDVGVSAASVSALLLGGQYPIRIGSVVAVEHRRQSKVDDFGNALDMLFAQFTHTIAKLEKLLDVTLCYPVNAMTAVCKKLSLPKKAALEAIDMFDMAIGNGMATAHDVYFALQEIPFILKSANTPESKLLSVEEAIARALTLRWEDYDLARAVSY